MKKTMKRPGMGWLPDYPDFRDYRGETERLGSRLERVGQKDSVKVMLTKLRVAGPAKASLPASVNLKPWCSPIEDQEDLGSCTANAGVGVVEYFERRAFGRHLDASRLFLYKVTRNLLHLTGDTGAYLRTTMAAMVLFGVPPEDYWPYDTAAFEQEPTAFCYAFAQSYQAIAYHRLDPKGTPGDALLAKIKSYLAAGLPPMFGFTVFSSYEQADASGKIPFPTQVEDVAGGHAVMAVGYDDALRIENTNPGGAETKGALLIRNSWGTGWGDEGYGWLPYQYVLEGLAEDWWALLKNEWVNTGNFGLPADAAGDPATRARRGGR